MHPDDALVKHLRLTDAHTKALGRLGIESVRDLFYYFPARYDDLSGATDTQELSKGKKLTIYGTIRKPKASRGWKTKITMAEAWIEHATLGRPGTGKAGKIKAVWFRQPYIAKMYPEGSIVKVEGTVSERKGEFYLSNPAIERATAIPPSAEALFTSHSDEQTDDRHLFPVYPETRGVTSRWIYYTLQKAISAGVLEHMDDPMPAILLKRYNLPTLKTALVWIHAPQKEVEARAARKRFAFEEIFFIQLKKQMERQRASELPSWTIAPEKDALASFASRFSFSPTNAQQKALKDIFNDFKSSHAMSRLLEGDVGSGKTFVAAVSSFATVTTRPAEKDFGNLQTALMAPTEILATQHFESFVELFRGIPIQIGLITSSGCRKFPSKVDPNSWTDISRAQLLKWVANGEIPILIGTHALIQKSVKFKHLAYVIIDEQHRFGTSQRATLARKDGKIPHLLSMTATPIPRTLALTIYGDLDLTLLDEMPPGRKQIITKNVSPSERKSVYEHLREEIKNGRQAYVICPRIDIPDETNELALQSKSVEEETKKLATEIFPELTIAPLHGKMTAAKKEETMERFVAGKIDILVATSVVEVGVNVPNATMIVIEGAERFGLSQLHQLRGRVLRSTHQSYCYLFTDSKAHTTQARLKALVTAKNGFELAERDLEFRGAGDLSGKKQWGITDVGMEALKNLKLVEAARAEARTLIERDPTLSQSSDIREALSRYEKLHFE